MRAYRRAGRCHAVCSGISSEAHKRVSIASEIVSKPPILFLGHVLPPARRTHSVADEPTSGLTSDGSLSVMNVIRDVCNAGYAVVSTIHQPAAEIFEMFDALLLLQRGGKTVYCGELGSHSATLTSYLERNGAKPCKPNEVCRATGHRSCADIHPSVLQNPADYMLREIAPPGPGQAGVDWPTVWRGSPRACIPQCTLTGADSKEYDSLLRTITSPNFLPRGIAPITHNSNLYAGHFTQARLHAALLSA